MIILNDLTDMNYVSAVYAVVVFIICIDWRVRGRRKYRGQEGRHQERAALENKSPLSDGNSRPPDFPQPREAS